MHKIPSLFFCASLLLLVVAAPLALAQMQVVVTQILSHDISAIQPTNDSSLVTITHTLKNVYEGANVTDITITDYLPLAATTQQNATEVDYQGAKWKAVTNTISQLASNEEKIISYNVTLPAGKNRLLLGRRIYFLGGQLEAGPQEKFVDVAGAGIQILWIDVAAAVIVIAAAIFVLKGKKRKTQRRVKH